MKTLRKIVGNIKIVEIDSENNCVKIENENYKIRIWNGHLDIMPKNEIGIDSDVHIHSTGLITIAEGNKFRVQKILTDNDRWDLQELPFIFGTEE